MVLEEKIMEIDSEWNKLRTSLDEINSNKKHRPKGKIQRLIFITQIQQFGAEYKNFLILVNSKILLEKYVPLRGDTVGFHDRTNVEDKRKIGNTAGSKPHTQANKPHIKNTKPSGIKKLAQEQRAAKVEMMGTNPNVAARKKTMSQHVGPNMNSKKLSAARHVSTNEVSSSFKHICIRYSSINFPLVH